MVVGKGVHNNINIGDYIQALAAKQYLPSTDVFLERETELHTYNGDEMKMIMNGWYMCHPENWPPSKAILPLFVAMHINVAGLPKLLESESISYLKNHQPIGCRDLNTVAILKEKGINAYFTGCLTLTLGKTYSSTHKNGKTYVVEAIGYPFGLKSIVGLKAMIYYLFNFKDVNTICRKKSEKGLRKSLYNAYFLYAYSKIFDKKLLVESEYINQYNEDIDKQYPSTEDKLNYAENLIRRYAEADCVITSRIHCALPCLGLGTPVIFIQNENDKKYSSDRFGGIIDLFNVAKWNGVRLKTDITQSLITRNNFPKNKQTWKRLADDLIKTCTDFINHNA